jgi:hypothetical protein
MWVSANYVCFDSRLMRQKFVIAFREVVKITRSVSHFGVLDSSLSIHTKNGEEVCIIMLVFYYIFLFPFPN